MFMKLISTLCFVVILQTSVSAMTDMSSLQKVLKKAADRDSNSSEMSGYDLFRSPIQPGGKWAINVNWGNVLKSLSGKMKNKMKLLEEYAAVLVESDPELIAMRNDDRPEKGFWKRYKALKAKKLAECKAELIERYTHELQAEARQRSKSPDSARGSSASNLHPAEQSARSRAGSAETSVPALRVVIGDGQHDAGTLVPSGQSVVRKSVWNVPSRRTVGSE